MRRLAWLASIAFAAISVSAANAQTVLEGPRLHYVLHCSGCHLQDGSETPGRVPGLKGVGVFLQVPEGRNFLIRVPGVANSPLDNADLADVLNWMVAEFGGAETPANWPRYTEAEVTTQRQRPALFELEKTRAALLEAIARN